MQKLPLKEMLVTNDFFFNNNFFLIFGFDFMVVLNPS